LAAIANEDWGLVLEIFDRASASEANAKVAVMALRRVFKYGVVLYLYFNILTPIVDMRNNQLTYQQHK
jgi:hypothetical protein